MKKILCFIIVALMGIPILIAQTPNYEGIIYVTPTGAGTQSGDSWANATSSIADAQALAQAHNAVVWVAAGIYYGDTTADNAFTMVNGVNVYGGFAGNEPANYDLSLRDFETNETILDGDSVRQVLRSEWNIDELTMWDGFTIRNGYVYGTDPWRAPVFIRNDCIFSHCKITNNIALAAIILYDAPRSIISDCVIENNNGWGVHGWGGDRTTNCRISNCQISNNTGGVSMRSYSGADSISFIGGNVSDSVIITNCDISNNNGYGIYGSNLTVQNCRISNNSGTGIMKETGVIVEGLTISHCVIEGNTYGGIAAGSSIISDCQIYNNTTTYNGGETHWWGDLAGGISANYCTISDCQIYNNTASFSGGGGIYDSGGSSISNCRIYNNTASFSGGGICNRGVSAISNCRIYNNTASNEGGGIYCYYNYPDSTYSYLLIDHCEISNNTAQRGGGVYIGCAYDFYGAHISNCLISNNTGGGVLAEGVLSLTSSTIVRNEGAGVRYYFDYSEEIVNCIIWGNETDGEASDIVTNYNDDINCHFSAIGGEGNPGEGNVFLQNEGILSPHFVNPSLTAGAADTTSNVDWHLLPNSISINRGTNVAVMDSLDLDGTARIKRDTVDMGCYESDYYNIHPNSTSIPTYDDGHFTVYPNPTTGMVNVRLDENGATWNVAEIQMFDVYGRLLNTVETCHGASLQTTQIDLSSYAPGIYLIKLVGDGRVIGVQKVVKR